MNSTPSQHSPIITPKEISVAHLKWKFGLTIQGPVADIIELLCHIL